MCVTLLYTPSAFIKMPFLLCALCALCDTFTCNIAITGLQPAIVTFIHLFCMIATTFVVCKLCLILLHVMAITGLYSPTLPFTNTCSNIL